MGLKKLGFELLPGTGWETAWAAAPAALAGFQAAAAQRQLGEVRTDIDNYRRQDIENPFANLSNPYENLAVATQAAEIKMEQTDQALANTLDTLRETGAAAGGATAIANAALKSKQGIAASIEQQEVNNQKLQAQGQLQVDIAKGKGETVRMQMQENRDINELNRLQAQSDMAQYRRDSSIQTGLSALGDAAAVRNAGIVPEKKANLIDYDGDGVKDTYPKRPEENVFNPLGFPQVNSNINPASPMVPAQNNLQSMRNPGNMQGNIDMLKDYASGRTKLEYMQDLDRLAQDETLGILDGEIVSGGISPYIMGPKDKPFFDASASNQLMFSNISNK